jgi:hypothetical protein
MLTKRKHAAAGDSRTGLAARVGYDSIFLFYFAAAPAFDALSKLTNKR